MPYYEMSPRLISKIEEIINHDVHVMGELAEIADYIDDPTLRAIIIGIIGDENGHVRFFRSLLTQVTPSSSHHRCHRHGDHLRRLNPKRNYRA
ncbi:MAG: hypothetical protein ACOXZ6_04650 [Syntrophomonadaceae bacterium]|jgi:rubrerythrin|nr:hypothetical protein [Bacillota bacterium]NLP25613.1 hypothetical protein [Syntrophomonadaceae bacterium]